MTFVFAVAVLAWMSGCKTVTSPSTTGSFSGRIVLFDSTRYQMPDFSGATVQLDGTSFHTTTDSLGAWDISGVPEGLYNISASKPGFGTYHWYQTNMTGGTYYLSTVYIARMPTDVPVLDSVWGSASDGGWQFVGHTTGGMDFVVGYCDTNSTIQPFEPHLATNLMGSSGGFAVDDLRTAGARSGQTLYISVSAVFNAGGDLTGFGGPPFIFFDPAHNEYRWASTGPKSNVITVTMP